MLETVGSCITALLAMFKYLISNIILSSSTFPVLLILGTGFSVLFVAVRIIKSITWGA